MTNLNCSYCGRKGLLIYPVRYGIACPNGQADVPGISANFKISGAPIDIEPAKYTLRMLRPGYLYTYEEKQKRLKAYIVLPKGTLWEFPVEYEPVVNPTLMNDCCLDRVSVALSYCIDIEPLPCEMMGNVWIGWSNVLWTKSNIGKISDADWRKKHMQCIDIKAMLHGSVTHAAKYKDASKFISYFSSDDSVLNKAFEFSNAPPSREKSFSKNFKTLESVLEERCPFGGFVVAVNDPVGVVNDLSELTYPTHHAGFDQEIYRGQVSFQLINSIENLIRREARESAKGDIIMERAGEINPEAMEADAVRKLWKMLKAGGIKNMQSKNNLRRKNMVKPKQER